MKVHTNANSRFCTQSATLRVFDVEHQTYKSRLEWRFCTVCASRWMQAYPGEFEAAGLVREKFGCECGWNDCDKKG